MTEEQKQKIKKLRYQGFGYKQIAKVTGLSRDMVRGYCLRNGLHGLATELVEECKEIVKEEFKYILCLNCGTKLEQTGIGRKRKFCSLGCKNVWGNTHKKAYSFRCEYCGKEFKSLGVKKRKYCNSTYYTKDQFWCEEHAAEVANKILEFKKVNHLPKWLKDLLLSDDES